MKNKIITGVIITSVLGLWLISFANADFSNLSFEWMQEMHDLMQKVKSWETLTEEEKAKLNDLKENNEWNFMWKIGNSIWNFWEKMWFWREKWFMNNLTDAEKESLKTMTADEKKAFMDKKFVEFQAKKEAHKNVINKLIDGKELTAEEKVVLQEIKTTRDERVVKKAEIDTLMNEMKPILTKVRAWETLTPAEQTKLDEFKAVNPGIWKGKWKHKGWEGCWLMWK